MTFEYGFSSRSHVKCIFLFFLSFFGCRGGDLCMHFLKFE